MKGNFQQNKLSILFPHVQVTSKSTPVVAMVEGHTRSRGARARGRRGSGARDAVHSCC